MTQLALHFLNDLLKFITLGQRDQETKMDLHPSFVTDIEFKSGI